MAGLNGVGRAAFGLCLDHGVMFTLAEAMAIVAGMAIGGGTTRVLSQRAHAGMPPQRAMIQVTS